MIGRKKIFSAIFQKNPRRNFSLLSKNKNKFVAFILSPLMLYLMFWLLLPMIFAIILSLYDYSARRVGGSFLGLGGNNPFIGLGNYLALFEDTRNAQQFQISLRNTVLFSFLVLPLNLLINIPLALAIDSVTERVKPIYRFIYFLPTVTAAVGVAIMWKYLYHPTQGLFNMILSGLGLQTVVWLGNTKAIILGVPLSMWSTIITYLWQDFGFNLIIFIAALQGICREYREAASVDGANNWQIFWKITLPQLQPTILFVCVTTMISSFQIFDLIWVMTEGGPMSQTRVLVMDIYMNAFRSGQMGYAGAEAIVLFLLVLVVTLFQMRLMRNRMEA